MWTARPVTFGQWIHIYMCFLRKLHGYSVLMVVCTYDRCTSTCRFMGVYLYDSVWWFSQVFRIKVGMYPQVLLENLAGNELKCYPTIFKKGDVCKVQCKWMEYSKSELLRGKFRTSWTNAAGLGCTFFTAATAEQIVVAKSKSKHK